MNTPPCNPLATALQRMPRLPGFAAWNADNALVDEHGLPLPWFHGTASEFGSFSRWEAAGIGFHFGPPEAANACLELNWGRCRPVELPAIRIIPVVARAYNPLRLDDLNCWEVEDVAEELERLGLLNSEGASYAIEASTTCGCAPILAALELAGHDAVLYQNLTEHQGNDCLFVWRPEQVKGAFAAAFDLLDPGLLPQARAVNADFSDRVQNRQTARMIDAAKAVLATLSSNGARGAYRG